MKDYIINSFTYFGCSLHQAGNALVVDLTPELAQYFGKSVLRLVFQPEHVDKNAELVTHGSYITNRIYDLLKYSGEKASITLPERQKGEEYPPLTPPGRGKRQKEEDDRLTADIIPYHCSIKKRLSRKVRKTEVFITFRIAYYSNEKFEELVTTGIDVEGRVIENVQFPYAPDSLKDATPGHFPFTRKQAKEIYDQCLRRVNTRAEQKALEYQGKLSKHYHQDVTRLEGYYQQMIDEIPDLAEDRLSLVRQFQHEYELKAAEELKKCHIQVSIEPMSFCTVTIPFRRYRYILQKTGMGNGLTHKAAVDLFQNLYSGTLLYPRCESCGKEMKEVGICEVKSHPVCRDCGIECHECSAHVCRDCGIEQCAECGKWVCHRCSQRCHLCGQYYCAEHLLGCLKCRDHFCRECAGQCEECGRPTGKIHLTECDITHKHVCLECIVLCSCCAKKVGQSQISTCGFCGQQACSECTFTCNICGKAFCVHHITECEISGKMVCSSHSGICGNCSQHVSAIYLNTCDVCGKKICAHCSVKCHECGAFFCEEHAGEMARCPECGNLYCFLCYSGQGICTSCRGRQ